MMKRKVFLYFMHILILKIHIICEQITLFSVKKYLEVPAALANHLIDPHSLSFPLSLGNKKELSL